MCFDAAIQFVRRTSEIGPHDTCCKMPTIMPSKSNAMATVRPLLSRNLNTYKHIKLVRNMLCNTKHTRVRFVHNTMLYIRCSSMLLHACQYPPGNFHFAVRNPFLIPAPWNTAQNRCLINRTCAPASQPTSQHRHRAATSHNIQTLHSLQALRIRM